MDNEQAEVYNDAGKKNIAKPTDIVDSSQEGKGEEMWLRGNDEVVSTKYNYEENNYGKKVLYLLNYITFLNKI